MTAGACVGLEMPGTQHPKPRVYEHLAVILFRRQYFRYRAEGLETPARVILHQPIQSIIKNTSPSPSNDKVQVFRYCRSYLPPNST